MSRKKKNDATFRDCVMERYKKDTIMHTSITLLVVVMPLIVMGIINALSNTDTRYSIMKEYQDITLYVCAMIEVFVIMAVLYQMYSRLRNHAKRDNHWRDALIIFVDKMGGDSTDMRNINDGIRWRELFGTMPLVNLLMVGMYIYCLLLFIVFIPQWMEEHVSDTYFTYAIAVGAGLCIFMFLVILGKILAFPHKHAKLQCEFTQEMSVQLAKVGITCPPMIKVVTHHNILLHILLLILTAGLYLIYIVFMFFKNFNYHLMNQWVYESELLKVVESNGHMKFEEYMPEYQSTSVLTKKKIRKLNKVNFKRVKTEVLESNKMPIALILAELFLTVLCANYVLKIVALDCEICRNYADYAVALTSLTDFKESLIDMFKERPKSLLNLIMVGVDLFFMMTGIGAMLGIASRRPASWRKVVRSCITFIVPLWISAYLTNASGITHLFDFNVYITTGVLLVVLLLMIASKSIREFYAPVGEEMPPLGTWARYAFFGKLESKEINFDSLEDTVEATSE